MGRIHIVPDVALKRCDQALIYDFRPLDDCLDEVVYMPHHQENFGNIGFLKLKLFCRRRRIRLAAFGHLNQLPEFSVLADRVILEPGDHLLERLYDDQVTKIQVHRGLLNRVSQARFIHGHGPDMKRSQHNYLLSRGKGELPASDALTPELLRDHETIIAAQNEIADREVIEAFTWPDVWIRRSSWDLFHSLDLPSNVVCSEIKRGWKFGDRIVRWLETCGLPRLQSVDQRFQQDLLAKVGAHFMAVQFLASWFKNWLFACVGGSANLFAILPVKALVLFDNWYDNACTEPCLRDIARRRYGLDGEEIPIFLPHRPTRPIETYLDEKRPILQTASERLTPVGYGGHRDTAAAIHFVTP
jgi:hypothetical protein